ncbi:hypothetical protein PM082_001824 [Marasmius tenuissimus]|nr:hypothetical protein PM082_001824 [Marasmius tenuissimus]
MQVDVFISHPNPFAVASHEGISQFPFNFFTCSLTSLSSKPLEQDPISALQRHLVQTDCNSNSMSLMACTYLILLSSSRKAILLPLCATVYPPAFNSQPSCYRRAPQLRSKEFSFGVGDEGSAQRIAQLEWKQTQIINASSSLPAQNTNNLNPSKSGRRCPPNEFYRNY